MYKLVAVDLDGTLLDDNKNIDEETIKSIREIVKNGVYFVFASGRPLVTQRRFFDKINVDMPSIACNGAIIAYPYEDKVIFNKHFKKEDLIFIVKYLKEKNKSFIAWENDKLYANVLDIYTTTYHDACKSANVQINVIEDYDKFYNLSINKLIVIDDSENIQVFLKDVKKDIKRKCNYFTSQSYFLEFTAKGVDKGKSLLKLAKCLGVKRSEIIAIGDGHNDLSMIKRAKLKVAMGQASEYVKSKANYITDSNNNLGVKKVLDTFILGQEYEER